MFRTLTAKFSGTCRRCSQPITPGTKIRYGGRGRTYHMAAECKPQSDPRYTPSTVSDVYGIGGKEYYRNKAGRCEDAPCCGCCTI